MIEDNEKIEVVNRFDGTTGYTIPDLGNLHRNFQPGEKKKISFEQLKKLSYVPGGMYLLRNALVIKNDEAIKQLLGDVQPEYYYGEKEIKNIMLYGSLDAFLDMIDFSPQGVKEMVKSLAVSLPLNDVAKRRAIKQKMDFDVDGAQKIQKQAYGDKKADTLNNQRRTTPPKINSEIKKERRIITS